MNTNVKIGFTILCLVVVASACDTDEAINLRSPAQATPLVADAEPGFKPTEVATKEIGAAHRDTPIDNTIDRIKFYDEEMPGNPQAEQPRLRNPYKYREQSKSNGTGD